MKKILFAFAISLIFCFTAKADYVQHDPIIIKDVHATTETPYIIEGYEISNPTGDCIKIINSKNVIIRNNFLHDCGTDKNFQKETDHYQEGYGTLIGDSSFITFESNKLDNNLRGFMAYNTPNLTVLNNEVTNTIQYSPLWCERCSDSEFAGNYLSDNGDPTHFWVPSDRSIGIWIKRSDNVEIHDNTVIRSTSDGISVTGHIYTPSFTSKGTGFEGPEADWSGLCNNVQIYNNLLLDNMEQGIWLVRARNIEVFNNTIRTGCFTHGASVSTEFDVGNSEFYNNKFLTCLSGPLGGANSFDNYVHDNTYYTYDGGKTDFMYFSNDPMDVGDMAKRNAVEYRSSTGNREENNEWIRIKGILSDEMKEKRDYAEENKTYEYKGWMACEQPDGKIDEECRIREESKGNQGVPKEELLYSSLMENFDEFATKEAENTKVQIEKIRENEGEICNYLPEKIYAALFFLTLAILIIVIFIKRK